MIVQLGQAEALLPWGRVAGVGDRGDDRAGVVAQNHGLAASRELTLVVALDEAALAAGGTRRAGAKGEGILGHVQESAVMEAGVPLPTGMTVPPGERVGDAALEGPAGDIDGLGGGVAQDQVFFGLVARKRKEIEAIDDHHAGHVDLR